MLRNRVNTLTDLLNEAANAYNERNMDALEELSRLNDDWLQGEKERDAASSVIESLMDAVDLLSMLEEE